MKKYRVYLGACDSYDADKITAVLEKALQEKILTKPISGKVVIKPNLVMAHAKVATEGYTRKEVVEGILRIVQKHGQDVEKIDIVEKSGLGITTAGQFRGAGYRPLKKKYGVKLRAMEERRRRIAVLEKGKIHRHISIAAEMAERDFLIFAPKLKTNVLTFAYSGALKLNIGTIDSKERLDNHNCHLPAKIVDILEAANPDLIVTDGIRFAFGGCQMTQPGADMGVIAVSNNAVAHDIVCAHLLGLDPDEIVHIREAASRDYGPSSIDEIEILGDFPIKKGRKICKKLDFGFIPVEKFPCKFKIHVGVPYCYGGCQGIFLDWLHMIKDKKPRLLKKFPKIDVIIGKVKKPIVAKKALLIGDCATASQVGAKKTVIIKGCPPSHKMIVWKMMTRFRLLAPMVRVSLIFDGFVLYPLKKIKGWFANLGYS
ncbi:MAG: DUF362 domain-containing protein [Candidatus Aminicenantes bacterium]|nr:DUF362 domain-containing protein [Candidatus Aminicenantes bacterium]